MNLCSSYRINLQIPIKSIYLDYVLCILGKVDFSADTPSLIHADTYPTYGSHY